LGKNNKINKNTYKTKKTIQTKVLRHHDLDLYSKYVRAPIMSRRISPGASSAQTTIAAQKPPSHSPKTKSVTLSILYYVLSLPINITGGRLPFLRG